MGLKAGIWASGLGFGPQGWDLGLKAGIWASRLGLGPQGWDLGFETGIWASRLGFKGGTETKEEKICFVVVVVGQQL